MKNLILLTFFFSSAVWAAQGGTVIVPKGKVHEFPRSDSRVIAELPKDSQVAVSNLPTEGFYKIRSPGGQMGWISGEEVLVSGPKASDGTPRPPKMRRMEEPGEENEGPNRPTRLRALLGYGLTNLAYGGLKDRFAKVSLLNFGTGFQLEFQKRMAELMYWGIRLETMSTSSGDVTLASGSTQTIKSFSLPLQIGLIFSPVNSKKFRFGIGAYGGVALFASTTVNITNSSTVAEVKYSSMDPVGTLATQWVYHQSKNFGFFLDLAYHYQKTALFPASTSLNVNGFQIDYTGYTGRAGLEFHFQ